MERCHHCLEEIEGEAVLEDVLEGGELVEVAYHHICLMTSGRMWRGGPDPFDLLYAEYERQKKRGATR